MGIDLIIVVSYFTIILVIALSGKGGKGVSAEQYFMSSRNLRWHSVAISTIATNVHGYQFLGMMGSAYLYGFAQANLEINAVQGLFLAAFVFVPLYLRKRITTITQFIQERLGKLIGRLYSLANIGLLSTVGLGAALFWGAYAADLTFGNYLTILGEDSLTRVTWLIVGLGIFSAIYTYFGGLGAVVRTDILQFSILTLGGIILLYVALNELGGWSEMKRHTPELMHLHLPADHPTLPWIAIFGMFLLNINYWCANQAVMQRSLAARSLQDAQVGLMVGGIMKYLMAFIIIVPGIALAGLLSDNPLSDPDQTFPYLVINFLPAGVRGIILCALFASLMSTVDSLFNSLSTLWSVDIMKGWLKPDRSDAQMVSDGRRMILVTLVTGVAMGWILAYTKFGNPGIAFTHTLNELRYYVNCGIVVLIIAAAFFVIKSRRWVLVAFLATGPLHILLQNVVPDMNYFVRSMWVILIALAIAAAVNHRSYHRVKKSKVLQFASNDIKILGWLMLISLGVFHIIWS